MIYFINNHNETLSTSFEMGLITCDDHVVSVKLQWKRIKAVKS